MKRIALTLIIAVSIFAAALARPAQAAEQGLLVLSYHDIPRQVNGDYYGVDREAFVQQIEYMRSHGYTFVSFDDVQRANRNEQSLPAKPVLLTFDDAYQSYYEFVAPLLKLYGYPSVLAVVTDWIDNPPKSLKQGLMTWDQLRELAASGLVTIATHSHNLHTGVLYNPQGNSSWAGASRIYDPQAQAYESTDAFRARIASDLARSISIIKEKLNVDARVMVWPYGQYNMIGEEECRKLGIQAMFALDDAIGAAHKLFPLSRVMITRNPAIADFIKMLKLSFKSPYNARVVHADLDVVYDPDPAQQEKNLDAFIERVVTIKPNTVYLQAYCDDAGTGRVSRVYFPNRILPVKADLFSRAVNQLAVRGIEVYAWMPLASYEFPQSQAGSEQERSIEMLYEDMSANARISGVLFLDDPYPGHTADELFAFTARLMKAVRYYRPMAKSARTLYSSALTNPTSEAGRAQDYARCLQNYDYVVIMAYPRMEKIWHAETWLKNLVAKAAQYPGALDKTVFKIQSYDWRSRAWIPTKVLDRWLRALVSSGARNIGYYPDDYTVCQPQARVIRLMISTEDFPFKRRWTGNEEELYK